jgi:hypothetical protein
VRLPAVYYFPNNIGVLGDNYIHLTSALRMQNYLKDHHLAYPLAAEKLVWLLLKMGAMSLKDPMFLEKAYVVGSWPVKFGMVATLTLIFTWFARQFRSVTIGWLAFFGAAVTYGCWIWGIHSNAIGLAIAAEILSMFLLLDWHEKKGIGRLLLFVSMNALCVLVYNGLLFFTAGMTLAFLAVNFLFNRQTLAKQWGNALALVIVSLIIGGFFYKLQADLHGTWKPSELYQMLGDTRYGGEIGNSMRGSLLATFKDNVVTSIMHFTNIWEPLTRVDALLILLQLTSIIALLIGLGMQPQRVLSLLRTPPAAIFLIASAIVFFCFMLNRTATHYSVITMIPNLFLLFFLIFSVPTNDRRRARAEILLTLFIVSSFFYSGFSSQNIYRGRDINGEFYYRENKTIYNNLRPNEQAIYFRDYEPSYIYTGLESYYFEKFGHIHWKNSTEIKDLRAKAGNRIFVYQSVLDRLNQQKNPPRATSLGDGVYEIN